MEFQNSAVFSCFVKSVQVLDFPIWCEMGVLPYQLFALFDCPSGLSGHLCLSEELLASKAVFQCSASSFMVFRCFFVLFCARHDMLSPGEMQRLSFVRLFFHSPPFAGQCHV